MNLLFCLEDILSYFRPLFNQQNFAFFQTMIRGFIANTHGGTLTRLYQSSFAKTKYWFRTKFLSRGEWDVDAVAARLVEKGSVTKLIFSLSETTEKRLSVEDVCKHLGEPSLA